MNTLTVPPSPNWYEVNVLACAPDNTLIYGARNDIIILENNSDPTEAATVRIIPRAHVQKILSININKNWGQPKKLAVSVSDDKIIKMWDVETSKKLASHNKHLSDNKVVGATFAGEERVISVSDEGHIVVWNISLNETTVLKDVFGMKVTVTCMSTCPHATWLTAFGLKSGLVIVADLRKNGKVLYKMRGHDKSVLSLSWCPVPINIFPKNPLNYVGYKKETHVETKEVLRRNECDVKEDLKSDSDTQAGSEEFLRECEILKNKILGTPESTNTEINDTAECSTSNSGDQLKRLILAESDKKLLTSLTEVVGDISRVKESTRDQHISDVTKVNIQLENEEHIPENVEKSAQVKVESGMIKHIKDTAADTADSSDTDKAPENASDSHKNIDDRVEKTGETKEDALKYIERNEIITGVIEDIMGTKNQEPVEDNNESKKEIVVLITELTRMVDRLDQVEDSANVESNKSDEQLVDEDVGKAVKAKVKTDNIQQKETTDMLNKLDHVEDSANVERKKSDGLVDEDVEKTVKTEVVTDTIQQKETTNVLDKLGQVEDSANVESNKSDEQLVDEDVGKAVKAKVKMDNIQQKETTYMLDKLDHVEDSANVERKKSHGLVDEDVEEAVKSEVVTDTIQQKETTNVLDKLGQVEDSANVERNKSDELVNQYVEKPVKTEVETDTIKQKEPTDVLDKPGQVEDSANVERNKLDELVDEDVEKAIKTEVKTDTTQQKETKDVLDELDQVENSANVERIKSYAQLVDEDVEKAVKTEVKTDTIQQKETTDAEKETANEKTSETTEATVSEASLESSVPKENGSGKKSGTKTNASIGRDIIKVTSQEEEPRKELLLASSAKEGNIYIWRAGTDGRLQAFLTIPNKSGQRKYKSNNDKIWITLCWISPTVLLSSSRYSELLAWNLPKPQDNTKVFTVIQKNHSSLLFSISAPIVLLSENNWKEESNAYNAWTTSQDRLLLNTNITKERSNLACYPTLGGTVYCLQLSPLDPNRLAIGTGDGVIQIWDLSRPHTRSIVTTNFYQKIQSKVSALAWHPSNELLLAFGTTEGRVGFMDPNNRSKMPVLLHQHFKSAIYALEWAPLYGNHKNFGIYVVSEGRMAFFDISGKLTKDPTEIDKPDDTFIYSLSWVPDYSLMVAVTKAGFVIVYSPSMKILCKHYFQYRLQEIMWHPSASDSTSKQRNWFAAIANLKAVVVYKFDFESGNNDENVVNIYQGKADLVHAVAWSPYEPTQLVIGCDIGIAQIWDVEKGEILATFTNTTYDAVTSVIWSPIDPDYIISGGKDHTLKIWKISEHPPIDEKEISTRRKKHLKEIAAESAHLLPKVEEPVEQSVQGKKQTKNGLLPNFYIPKDISQIVSDLRKLLRWKENTENVEVNVNFKNDILDVFGSDSAMLSLVTANELAHKQRGKYKLNTTLSLFRGDISTAVKEAIEEKRVNLRIISLAPMVSPKLWQSACETYAIQLSEQSGSDPLEIATYYLACHKVQEAVNALCDAFMFREALALAKCRMLGKEVVNEVIDKWAIHARYDGNFEVAAQCYIFLGKYEDAATLLFRRSDLQILELVVELAEKSGNEELHKAALFRFNSFKTDADGKEKEEIALLTKQEVFLQHNNVNATGDTKMNEESNKETDVQPMQREKDENAPSDDLKNTENLHDDAECKDIEVHSETDDKVVQLTQKEEDAHTSSDDSKSAENKDCEIPSEYVKDTETDRQIGDVIENNTVVSDTLEEIVKTGESEITPSDVKNLLELEDHTIKYETGIKNGCPENSLGTKAKQIETDLQQTQN